MTKQAEDPAVEQKRSTLFTVKDAEDTMVSAACIVIFGLLVAYLYEGISTKSWFKALFHMTDHIPRILSVGTVVIIVKEGVDIMLFRRTARLKKKYRAEGKAKGRAEMHAKWADWADNGRDEHNRPTLPPSSNKDKRTLKNR